MNTGLSGDRQALWGIGVHSGGEPATAVLRVAAAWCPEPFASEGNDEIVAPRHVKSMPSTENSRETDSSLSCGQSIFSWLCLFLSIGLLAALTLAPKLLARLHLQEKYFQTQVRLVDLERQVLQLSQMAEALRDDRELGAELARADFNATKPGEERIPVSAPLHFPTMTDSRPVNNFTQPARWLVRGLEVLSRKNRIRMGLLSIAAMLTIISFTSASRSPQSAGNSRTGLLASLLEPLGMRYRRP